MVSRSDPGSPCVSSLIAGLISIGDTKKRPFSKNLGLSMVRARLWEALEGGEVMPELGGGWGRPADRFGTRSWGGLWKGLGATTRVGLGLESR